MPITIDVSKLKLDWSVELGNKRRLHQVAVANSQWTPAVDANYAYAFVGGILSALDKKTGAVVYF